MKGFLQAISNKNNHYSLLKKDLSQTLFLIIITILAHGLFIPWLGFYGDDWGFLWLSYRTQSPALLIPQSRFLLPELYNLVATFLSPSRLHWHVFFLLIRIFCVINCQLFVRSLWPNNPISSFWIALFLTLYPGALMSLQSVTYWPIFFQLNLLLASFWLMLKSISSQNGKTIYYIISLIFAWGYLTFSEYLFFLEMLRLPVLMIFFLNQQDRLKKSIKLFFPFMASWILISAIRFLNQQQLSSYYQIETNFFTDNPFRSAISLFFNMLRDIVNNGLLAWIKPIFDSQLYVHSGKLSLFLFFLISIIAVGLIILFGYILNHQNLTGKTAQQATFLGLFGVFLANIPFWLGRLVPDVGVGVFSRFSIPATLGSALLIYGILSSITKSTRIMVLFFSCICGLSLWMHLLTGNLFRKEWKNQNKFFWKIAWRMPATRRETETLSNKPPIYMISENTLTAAINWIYTTDEPPVDQSKYRYYYDIERFNRHIPAQQGVTYNRSFILGEFSGDSSNVVVIYNKPAACLRVINSNWDLLDPDIPGALVEIASIYPNHFILTDGNAESILKADPIFSDENRAGFCYYYQKASLAVQQQDWELAIQLGQQANEQGIRPNEASERFPFMLAFVHSGELESAYELSNEIMTLSQRYAPMVCAFWEDMLQQKVIEIEDLLPFAFHEWGCAWSEN